MRHLSIIKSALLLHDIGNNDDHIDIVIVDRPTNAIAPPGFMVFCVRMCHKHM